MKCISVSNQEDLINIYNDKETLNKDKIASIISMMISKKSPTYHPPFLQNIFHKPSLLTVLLETLHIMCLIEWAKKSSPRPVGSLAPFLLKLKRVKPTSTCRQIEAQKITTLVMKLNLKVLQF